MSDCATLLTVEELKVVDCYLSLKARTQQHISLHRTLSFPPCRSVALWSLAKKKPVQYRPHDPASKGVGTCISENWVSAVTALPFSDLVASGEEGRQ